MQKFLVWCKQNWIELSSLFILAFIPLYPKLPLLDVVQTWVYIRLDDFLIALVVLVFLLKLYRARYIPWSALTYPILIYWTVGALSVAYSLAFIGPRLLGYFPQLVVLHYLRRIEYMIVFFIAIVGMRSLKSLKYYLIVFALTVGVVSLYGLGQRFARFPAFLTMNEEFAKGTALYLSPSSRITSTFAGHYDLAMYLAFALTMFSGVFFGLRRGVVKFGLLAISLLGVAVLLMTQSRVSLVALGIGIFLVLWWQKKKTWIVPVLILGIVVTPFISGISGRFAKTFRDRTVVFDIRAGIPIGSAHVERDGHVVIENSESPAKENLPSGSGFIRVPLGPQVPLVASFAVGELRKRSDYPIGGEKPGIGEELQMAAERNLVYLSSTKAMAISSGEVASVSGRFLLDRALLYDISFTTRLQGTWPRAWEAFRRNVILGSGYSVLSLASDSDYLRTLGETGIVGFASFFFIFIIFFLFASRAIRHAPPLVQGLSIGTAAGVIGLLVTATLIDVFEASKVAYVFWLTLGATVAGLSFTYKRKFLLWEETRRVFTHPLVFMVLLGLLVPVIYGNVTNFYFVADDFTWLRWATQSSLGNLPAYFTNAAGFFYRPLTKLYFFIASLVFWLKPFGYHAVNLFFHFGATALTYFVVRKITKRPVLAVLTSLYFLVLAIHHENVVWISGVSSLAGSFFALLALYFFMYASKKWWGILSLLASIGSMATAMFFYEEMLLTPLILIAFAWFFWPKKFRVPSLALGIAIPVYWWVRTAANALPPSGTYGVNLQALPFNLVGNVMGYTMITIFGPGPIGIYTAIRSFLRESPLFAGLILFIGIVGLGATLWKYRSHIRLSAAHQFFLLFTFIALLPSLGLGNIAERYGYLASAGMSFLFVSFTFWLYRWRGWGIATCVFVFSLVLNYYQLAMILRDWQQVGKLSDRILYEMRRKYYPLESQTQFVVANVPTRLGRAWVFPVGLGDAAYLTFRDTTMRLDVVGSEKDALEVKRRNPDKTKALTIDDVTEHPVRELYE